MCLTLSSNTLNEGAHTTDCNIYGNRFWINSKMVEFIGGILKKKL